MKIKRVYENPEKDDGARILVDRLWPRGLTKEKARVDLWLKDIAPSTELRKWFGHDPARWNEFRQRYREELKKNTKPTSLLKEQLKKGAVTLVYGAKDEEHNKALVLKEIFNTKQAITESHIYDMDIHNLANQKKDAKEIYETLSQRDIQKAADQFGQLYESTKRKDGYVSLEVNPHLAHDTNGTIDEARRLWAALNRPNVFIEVPATDEGLPAIQQLISEGINVNVTLIFGLSRYRQVINAYLSGITARADQGNPIHNVASVASFFLSRKDAVIDPIEEAFVALGGEQAHFATNIHGQVAISSAKLAYQIYKQTFESEQFVNLVHKGAIPQRLLWASTSHENPESRDIKYIEALIGADTIITITPETFEVYRKHGKPAPRLEYDLEQAHWVMSELLEIGIDIDKIISKLEEDGIAKYIKSFDRMMEGLINKSSGHSVMAEKF